MDDRARELSPARGPLFIVDQRERGGSKFSRKGKQPGPIPGRGPIGYSFTNVYVTGQVHHFPELIRVAVSKQIFIANVAGLFWGQTDVEMDPAVSVRGKIIRCRHLRRKYGLCYSIPMTLTRYTVYSKSFLFHSNRRSFRSHSFSDINLSA